MPLVSSSTNQRHWISRILKFLLLKTLILELAFKEMTDSVTHSDSFRISVQSLWGLAIGARS